VDPWISERDRRFAVDKEVQFRDSQLCQSMKPLQPIVYGKLDPLTIGYLLLFAILLYYCHWLLIWEV